MNNIREIKREQFTELFAGLATNTNLEELHLCNTGIGDLVAQVLIMISIWWADECGRLLDLGRKCKGDRQRRVNVRTFSR